MYTYAMMLAVIVSAQPKADDWATMESAHLKNIRQVTTGFLRAGEGYFAPDGKKIIYQAENILDAHLVRGALENAGIPAFVSGEFLTGAMGELPAIGLVAVMVPEPCLPEARAIALEIDQQLSESRAIAAASGDRADPEPA